MNIKKYAFLKQSSISFPADIVVTITAKQIHQTTYLAFVSMLLAKWNSSSSALLLALRIFGATLLRAHGDSLSFKDESLCFLSSFQNVL